MNNNSENEITDPDAILVNGIEKLQKQYLSMKVADIILLVAAVKKVNPKKVVDIVKKYQKNKKLAKSENKKFVKTKKKQTEKDSAETNGNVNSGTASKKRWW